MLVATTIASLAALLPLGALAAPIVEERAVSDRFTLYDLPTPLTGPCDLEHGPDGALWGQVCDEIHCSLARLYIRQLTRTPTLAGYT